MSPVASALLLVLAAALAVAGVIVLQRRLVREPTALQVAAAQLEATKLDALEAHRTREQALATVAMLADRERRLRATVQQLSAEQDEVQP